MQPIQKTSLKELEDENEPKCNKDNCQLSALFMCKGSASKEV